jgi:hypothetical protein
MLIHRPIEILVFTRTSIFVCTGPANIFGERTPCKKMADVHPRKGNLLQRNNLQGCIKSLFASQNRVEIS